MNIIYFTHIHYLHSLIFAVFEFCFNGIEMELSSQLSRQWSSGVDRWWKQPSRHSRDHSTGDSYYDSKLYHSTFYNASDFHSFLSL